MFMNFGKSLGFGEIDGLERWKFTKCAWKETSENVADWQLSAKLKFSLNNDP